MLKAGYLVELLEKLPYETEVDFYASMDLNANIFVFENDGGSLVESDEENIIIDEDGVTIILYSYEIIEEGLKSNIPSKLLLDDGKKQSF